MANKVKDEGDSDIVKVNSSTINDELDLLIEDLNNFAVLDIKPSPADFDKMLADFGTRSSTAQQSLKVKDDEAGTAKNNSMGTSKRRQGSPKKKVQDPFEESKRNKSESKAKDSSLKQKNEGKKAVSTSSKSSHEKKRSSSMDTSKKALKQQAPFVHGEPPSVEGNIQTSASPARSESEKIFTNNNAIQHELSNLLACLEQDDIEEIKQDIGTNNNANNIKEVSVTTMPTDLSSLFGSRITSHDRYSPISTVKAIASDPADVQRENLSDGRVQDINTMNPRNASLFSAQLEEENTQSDLDAILNTLVAETIDLNRFNKTLDQFPDQGDDAPCSTKTVGLIPAATPETIVPSTPKATQFDDTDAKINGMIQTFQNETTALRTEDQSSGICHTCHKPIFGNFIQVLGLVYHIEHFICSMCGRLLDRKMFYGNKGAPCCRACSTWNTSLQCSSCQKPITEKAINAFGKYWHPQCFECFKCQQVLTDRFFDIQNIPCCEACYREHFSPRCKACGEIITENYLNAIGAQWHEYHFVCRVCGVKLESYFEKDGFPYCKQHFSSEVGIICASCSQPITDLYIEAFGKKWHSDHFVCTFCSTPLPGKKYFEKQGKPYCSSCTNKLFVLDMEQKC